MSSKLSSLKKIIRDKILHLFSYLPYVKVELGTGNTCDIIDEFEPITKFTPTSFVKYQLKSETYTLDGLRRAPSGRSLYYLNDSEGKQLVIPEYLFRRLFVKTVLKETHENIT